MILISTFCLGLVLVAAVTAVVLAVRRAATKPSGPPPRTHAMLDLSPPVASDRASWVDPPSALSDPLFPALPANTGWLGVHIAMREWAPTNTVSLVGLARVPKDQAPSLRGLEVVFENRATGERLTRPPVFVELPKNGADDATERPLVALERATLADRSHAVMVGFYLREATLQLPAAEYRVFVHVDVTHSNELRFVSPPGAAPVTPP